MLNKDEYLLSESRIMDFFDNKKSLENRFNVDPKIGEGYQLFYPIDKSLLIYAVKGRYCFDEYFPNIIENPKPVLCLYKITSGSYILNIKDDDLVFFSEGPLIHGFDNTNIKSCTSCGDYVEFVGLCFYLEKLKDIFDTYDLSKEMYDSYFKKLNNNHGLLMFNSAKCESLLFEVERYIDEENLFMLKNKALEYFYFSIQEAIDNEIAIELYNKGYIVKVTKVKDFIEKNWTKNYSIEYLSKKFYINSTYLKTLFKKIYKVPPYTYIKNYRLEKATYLLANSNYSVQEIANTIGYSSCSKFSAAFKELNNVTPLQYRKHNF